MAHIIENSTDLMETAEDLNNTLKLLENAQEKICLLESALESKDNSRITYSLMTQLPQLKALVNVCRNNVCDNFNDMELTFNKKFDDETEQM